MTSEAFRIRFGLTSGQQYTARRRGLVQCHNIGKRAYYEEPTAEAARAIRELGRSSRSPRGYIPLNEFRKKHGISSRQGRRLIDAGLLKIRQIDVRQFVGPLSKEAAAEIAEMTAASAIYREGAPAGLITRRELLSLLRITQHQLEQLLEEGLITKSSLRERTLFDPPSETAIARAAELVMLSRASRGLKANGHFTGRQLCKASRAPMTTVRSVLRQLDRLLVTRGRFKLIPADVFEALVYVCKHYPEYGHRRTVDLLKAGKIVGSQLLVLRHEDYGDIKAVSPEGEDPRYVLVEILLLKYRRESGQILLIEKEGRVLTKEQATQMLGFGEHILDAETRSHIFQRSPHPDRPYYEMEILWRKQEMLQ